MSTSFLIDRDGQLAVIYRGPVSVDQLREDTERLTWDKSRWQAAALPLPGRWNESAGRTDLLRIPRELLDRGELDDALAYVQRHGPALAANAEFPKLRVWLGDQLITPHLIEYALKKVLPSTHPAPLEYR